MKFKKLKDVLSKTDFIRIEVDGEHSDYLASELVPDKYDDYQVVGVGHEKDIHVHDAEKLHGSGIEVVLRKKSKKKKDVKEDNRNDNTDTNKNNTEKKAYQKTNKKQK